MDAEREHQHGDLTAGRSAAINTANAADDISTPPE